jgi:hypothetical protein
MLRAHTHGQWQLAVSRRETGNAQAAAKKAVEAGLPGHKPRSVDRPGC